ncbi:MAG: hypothetical protein VW298_01565 [Candidatus Woesearchaeota archaeon]
MKIIKLLFTLFLIPVAYSQTIFDNIKDSFELVPKEYLNLIISAFIIYAIFKYAIEISIKDNSASNIIAVTLSAAGTYLIYFTNFPFIAAISPFIIYLVTGYLALMIKRVYSNYSTISKKTKITNGIILIIFSYILLSFSETVIFLNSYINLISSILFLVGIIMIIIAFFSKNTSTPSPSTPSPSTPSPSTPSPSILSKSILEVENSKSESIESESIESESTEPESAEPESVKNEEIENIELSKGIYKVHHGNIISELKLISGGIQSLNEEFEKEFELYIKDQNLFENITKSINRISRQSRICHYLCSLARTDSEDFIKLLEKIIDFESKWGDKIRLNDEQKALMVQEHKAIILEYNSHNSHKKSYNHDQIKSKLSNSFVNKYFHLDFIKDTTKLLVNTIHSEKSNSEITIDLNDLLSEKKDLFDILTILSEQIRVFESLNEDLLKNYNTTIKVNEIIRNTRDLMLSQNNKLLSLKSNLDSSSNMINMIDNKIITIDQNLIQGVHNLHNSGYQRNDDEKSNMYGTWEKINNKKSSMKSR